MLVIILCSGNNGLFSYEDSMCAGAVISEIKNLFDNISLDDASKVCIYLYNKHKMDLEKALRETEHGNKLISEGFIEDVNFAANMNSTQLIPYFESGSIKLLTR